MNELTSAKSGYLIAVASAFFYALQVVVGKVILQTGFDPRNLLVIQYSGCTVILMLFLLSRRKKTRFRPERRFLKPIVIQGIFGCCGTSFFFYLALDRVNAGVCSMLLYLCPVYVCLFFMMTGIRKINALNKISVVLAFAGAMFVLNIFGLGDMKWSLPGLALGTIAGLCYAFYGIHADIRLKEMPAEQMLFYMYFTATVSFWVLNPGFVLHPPEIGSAKIVLLILASIFLQVLPMSLLNLAIRMIGSNKATVIATAELPFTIILAFFLLREQMVPVQILGILLIVAAVVLLQVKKEKQTG